MISLVTRFGNFEKVCCQCTIAHAVLASGLLTWTPTSNNRMLTDNLTLSVQVGDNNGGASELTIPIQLCICTNNGTCLYNETLDEVENFEV